MDFEKKWAQFTSLFVDLDPIGTVYGHISCPFEFIHRMTPIDRNRTRNYLEEYVISIQKISVKTNPVSRNFHNHFFGLKTLLFALFR
jgi:hypothetical protein